jgi:hypothetical protein
MDIRLKTNAILQVVGPSGSGKTYFVCRLLSTPHIFKDSINNIYWLMGTSEGESGDTMKCMNHLDKSRLKIVHGFETGWQELAKKNDVMVIDDLFHESTKEKDFVNLFTKIARHRHVLVIFITQNLFHQGGHHRTQNLNVHYLCIFRNPRDKTVIDHLARQMFPENRKFLISAFEDATKNMPHAYLFLDFTQECDDAVRVRTNILTENGNYLIVYKHV